MLLLCTRPCARCQGHNHPVETEMAPALVKLTVLSESTVTEVYKNKYKTAPVTSVHNEVEVRTTNTAWIWPNCEVGVFFPLFLKCPWAEVEGQDMKRTGRMIYVDTTVHDMANDLMKQSMGRRDGKNRGGWNPGRAKVEAMWTCFVFILKAILRSFSRCWSRIALWGRVKRPLQRSRREDMSLDWPEKD